MFEDVVGAWLWRLGRARERVACGGLSAGLMGRVMLGDHIEASGRRIVASDDLFACRRQHISTRLAIYSHLRRRRET